MAQYAVLGDLHVHDLFGVFKSFDLSLALWICWGIDGLIIYLIGGVALGWAGHRFAAT